MDQIKKIIAGAQKHAFWIVSALTVLLGIVGYSISRSTMSAVFKAQATKIDSQYSALSTISNEVSTHPNSKTHAQMDKQIAALSEDVQRAWVKQYERQAEILKWPVGPIPEKFIAKVEKLRPIELALEFPPADRTDPLVVNDRVQYAKYINEQFPVLAKIIGTEWVGTPAVSGSGGGYGGGMAGGGGMMAGGGMMGGGSMMGGGASGGYGSAPGGEGMAGGMLGSGGMPGMGMAAANRNADLVIWSKASQDAVLADVQTWRSKYPSTHDVLYTQENIWILKGLLEIIAKVNAQANAVANFQATVKEIEFLRIGRAAVGKVGTVDRPGDGNAAGGMGSSMGIGIGIGSEGLDATAEGGGGSDSGSMASGANIADGSGEDSGATGMVMATPDPANGRYVDAAYAPLTGDDLRAKMKSSSPEDAYFAVAKRVPVRMRLKADQRKIQTLVAELGNANLLFEIRQIRIGDTTPAPAAGAGGGYGMDPFGGSGSGPSMGGMMGGGMMGGGMMGSGMMGGSGMPGMGMAAPGKIWDIPVEIYGVVYLFNPPDAEKLGLNDVTAETEVADKVEISADVVQANEAQQGNTGDASPDAAGNNATTAPGGMAPDGGTPNGNAPDAGIPNGGVPGAPGINVPGGNIPGSNIPGSNIPGGNIPGGNVPGGNIPGGNVPGGNVPGGNVPGGNVPGGNVPVTGVPTGGVPGAIGGNVPAAAGGVNPAAAGGGVPSANVPVN